MRNKTYRTNITFALLSSLIILCSSFQNSEFEKENGVKVLSIRTSDLKENGKLSDYFRIDSVIALETRDDCLINRIEKVKIANKDLFIFDHQNQKLLHYHSNGSFLGQIGRPGKGPGEYVELMDFEIDSLKREVYLVDVKKIHRFSFEGKFIKTYRTDFFAAKLSLSSENCFIFYGAGREHRIITSDYQFKKVRKFYPYQGIFDLDNYITFSTFQDNPLIHLPNQDTLFGFANRNPTPKFYMDFNGKNFKQKDYEKLSITDKSRLFDHQLKSGKFVRCLGFLPCSNYVLMILNFSNRSFWGLYNIDSDQCSFTNYKNIKNDIFGSFMFFNPRGYTGTEIIFSVSPHVLLKDKSSSFYDENIHILEKITEYANPVLLFATPKL